MISSPLLIAAFAMGFFGSPHCLGMCGGLVTAFGLSMQELSPLKKRGLIATYHLGRLLSYAFLGLIAAVIGTTILAPIMQGNVIPRIFLGCVLVFIGLSMLGLPFLNKLEKVGMGFWKKLSPLRQKIFPITSFPRALSAGLLWGFLPCGLVYGALLMSAVGNNVLSGALLMFIFGLGTVPMLVATQETVGWLHKQIGRFRLRQLNGIIMVLSGIAVIALPILMTQLGVHSNHSSHAVHDDSSHQYPITSHTNPNPENVTNHHNNMTHDNHMTRNDKMTRNAGHETQDSHDSHRGSETNESNTSEPSLHSPTLHSPTMHNEASITSRDSHSHD